MTVKEIGAVRRLKEVGAKAKPTPAVKLGTVPSAVAKSFDKVVQKHAENWYKNMQKTWELEDANENWDGESPEPGDPDDFRKMAVDSVDKMYTASCNFAVALLRAAGYSQSKDELMIDFEEWQDGTHDVYWNMDNENSDYFDEDVNPIHVLFGFDFDANFSGASSVHIEVNNAQKGKKILWLNIEWKKGKVPTDVGSRIAKALNDALAKVKLA